MLKKEKRLCMRGRFLGRIILIWNWRPPIMGLLGNININIRIKRLKLRMYDLKIKELVFYNIITTSFKPIYSKFILNFILFKFFSLDYYDKIFIPLFDKISFIEF